MRSFGVYLTVGAKNRCLQRPIRVLAGIEVCNLPEVENSGIVWSQKPSVDFASELCRFGLLA
jgi:hypothetical protein